MPITLPVLLFYGGFTVSGSVVGFILVSLVVYVELIGVGVGVGVGVGLVLDELLLFVEFCVGVGVGFGVG